MKHDGDFNNLEVWTIYKSPADTHYAARRHDVGRKDGQPIIVATEHVITAPTLDELRTIMQNHGRVYMPRHPDDNPEIVESWI